MKSPTGLYCVNSQKRTESLLLPSSPTIQADLSVKRPVHPTHMQWLKYCIRGQVRSHGFAARQRYVEDVVAPPTGYVFSQALSR